MAKLQVGVNDLATTHPHLVTLWVDDSISPQQITAGSHRKVLWTCSLEHKWTAAVYSRVVGRDCPYCCGRLVLIGFNDLATTHPHLVPEWNDSTLSPYEVSEGSGKSVSWKCSEGHEWVGRIAHRAQRNVGCAACVGQRKWTNEEDDYLRAFNGVLTHAQMGRHLKRNKNTVDMRFRVLGLSGKYLQGGHWDTEGNHITSPKQKYGIGWKARRVQVLERDGFLCQHPGCKFYSPSGKDLHVHHIKPRKFGIDDNFYNLITLCEEHHGGQPAHYWNVWNFDALPTYQKIMFESVVI